MCDVNLLKKSILSAINIVNKYIAYIDDHIMMHYARLRS